MGNDRRTGACGVIVACRSLHLHIVIKWARDSGWCNECVMMVSRLFSDLWSVTVKWWFLHFKSAAANAARRDAIITNGSRGCCGVFLEYDYKVVECCFLMFSNDSFSLQVRFCGLEYFLMIFLFVRHLWVVGGSFRKFYEDCIWKG